MTDIAKALAFATHCLKWVDAKIRARGVIYDVKLKVGLNLKDAANLQSVLEQFLGNRYFIQINRDKTGLFQWQVLVGLQDLTGKAVSLEHARADGEVLWDVIFDACVDAARMFADA